MDGKRYSDAQLISAAKSGDMQAAYALYRANMPLILKYARRYAFIDAAFSVDDLTQEAWFAILRAVWQFDPARGTWAQALVWSIRQQIEIVCGCTRGIVRKWFPSIRPRQKMKPQP